MNAAQIIRLALENIDAINASDSTTDAFYRQSALLAWATRGKDEVEKILRTAQSDYPLVTLQSGDGAYRWCGEYYSPSSLQITSTSKRLQLPPDLLVLKRVRCTTAGYEHVRFTERDLSTNDARTLEQYDYPLTDEIVWDVVGERTLYLLNVLNATLDIELAYIARSGPLQLYTTGTITFVQSDATISGASTEWVIDELRNNLELIVSDDATAPKIVSQTSGGTWVDPSVRYSPVSSITSDTELELAGPWLNAGAAGRGYMLATVPAVPADHHDLIADYVAKRAAIRAKDGAAYKLAAAEFKEQVQAMKADIQDRQTHSIPAVEAWNPYRRH